MGPVMRGQLGKCLVFSECIQPNTLEAPFGDLGVTQDPLDALAVPYIPLVGSKRWPSIP